MAAKGTFPIKVESNLHGFAIVLKSAACEWLLLFLLLLDAAFSFLLTKFAEYCELQLPCIFCSRLDHVFGNEKPGFYRNFLCNEHRSEMSALVLCQKHGKLADAHEMCEECLLSFAKKESSQEMFKILVGKLGPDCLQKPFLNMDSGLSTRLCSCCTKPWRSRPNINKMVQSRPSGPASKPDIPLPRSPGRRCLNRQEGLKKRKDRFSMSPAALLLGNPDHDSLSHLGYSEVKINSDSESDFPFSDDEDMIPFPCGLRRVKDEYLSQKGSKLSPRKHDDISQAGLIHKPVHCMNNHMHFDPLSEKDGAAPPKAIISNGDIRHTFAEANWQHIRHKASPALSEFTSLDDVSLSSSSPASSPAASGDEGDRVSDAKKSGGPGFSDPVFHNNVLPSRSMQMPSRLSRESRADTTENGDIEHTHAMNNWESIDLNSTTTAKGTATDSFKKDAVSIPNNATNDTGELPPGIRKDVKLSEKHSRKDCNGIGSNEETALRRTSSPVAEPLVGNKNPMANGHADGHHVVNTPNTIDSPMCSKSPSIINAIDLPIRSKSPGINTIDSPIRSKSPNMFSRESLEAFTEIEGESPVDKLKRQVEYYKKCMNKLFQELEAERNASAIAANQAMAMITKLQEEKAALHMEACQYLRMMDEQAEYDVDALEKANDLIAEKEKEIQDLEAELDYYRIKYPENFPEYSDMLDRIVGVDGALDSNMEDVHIEEL